MLQIHLCSMRKRPEILSESIQKNTMDLELISLNIKMVKSVPV